MTTTPLSAPGPIDRGVVDKAAQLVADEFGLLTPGPEEESLARAVLEGVADEWLDATRKALAAEQADQPPDPKAYIEAHRADGVACPTCGQLCKVYRRRVNKAMVMGLVRLASITHGAYVHAPSVEGLSRLGGELARLALWDLIEEETRAREDGGRAGWWRITDEGRAFLEGKRKITKFALIYLGQHEGFDGPEVTVEECYGEEFDLQALMRGE